jgi:DNA polymerase
MQKHDAEKLRRALVGRLESLERAGVMQLPKAKRRAAVMEEPRSKVAATPAAEAASPMGGGMVSYPVQKVGWGSSKAESLFDAVDSAGPGEAKAPTLEVLQQLVTGCTRCEALARTRTQTVFGVGNPAARLCFLGEAPGADEDRLGEPFVGRAGQMLTRIIENVFHMKREDVYILNMLKCRPPGNRNPLPDELTNCRGYLERQFDLIRPEFICCLGAVAAQNLLNTTVSIGKLRGKVHAYRGAKVVCTYHPAFLLRSPGFKQRTWEDMKLLMREMGVEIE